MTPYSQSLESPTIPGRFKRYDIRAGVYTIHGYSAHADQQNLVNFVKRMRHRPKTVYLVHGEQRAKEALQDKLGMLDNGIKVVIPD